MLLGKRKTFLTNTGSLEHLSVLMKPIKGLLNGTEWVLVNGGVLDEVTEVKEGGKCPDHVVWDMTLNSWEVDLGIMSLASVLYQRMRLHFHQGLRVVSSPLTETPPLLEPAKTWIGRCHRNTVGR